MIVLVLNCGSSSIKYQVIDINEESNALLAKGLVDRIGLPEGSLTHKPVGKNNFELKQSIPDHTTGISLVLEALTNKEHGVISSLDEVKAVYSSINNSKNNISKVSSALPPVQQNSGSKPFL